MAPDRDRPIVERSPSVPEVPLAATREDFMNAATSLGSSNQVGSRVFTAAFRKQAGYPLVRVDGEPAVSPEVIETIATREHTAGIRKKGRAIIECLYQDILRRQGRDPQPR